MHIVLKSKLCSYSLMLASWMKMVSLIAVFLQKQMRFQAIMYDSKPSVVYGFHGLDRTIAFKILNQEYDFKPSNNKYDWLGNGIYFGENNYERAQAYALLDSRGINSKINDPFVLGAVIELGNCLDLLNHKSINFLKLTYKKLKSMLCAKGLPLPSNKPFGKNDFDFKLCAVIRFACSLAAEQGHQFDSVRAAFIEGSPLYKDACFYSENHIQLSVINPDCIKGVFLPRKSKI